MMFDFGLLGQLPAAIAPQGTDNPYGDAFVMEFNIATNGETLTIPCVDVGVFNAVIDWGDGGATSTISTYDDADLSHVYAAAGDYIVQITGQFPNIRLGNSGHELKLTKIRNFGDVGWTSLREAFAGCTNLTEVSYYTANMTGLRDASAAFMNVGCVTLDLPGFIDGAVFDEFVFGLASMFQSCENLTTLRLTGWNITQVPSCNHLVSACTALQTVEISGGVITCIGPAREIVSSCGVLTSADLSGVNTDAVTDLSYAFSECYSLESLNISTWTTGACESLQGMFYASCAYSANPLSVDISGFDTSAVTDMSYMFYSFNNGYEMSITGMSAFDVSAVSTLDDFAASANIPTAEYDALLIAWAAQNVNSDITVSFGTSTYTGGGAAAAARAYLIGTKGWAITDGGTA